MGTTRRLLFALAASAALLLGACGSDGGDSADPGEEGATGAGATTTEPGGTTASDDTDAGDGPEGGDTGPEGSDRSDGGPDSPPRTDPSGEGGGSTGDADPCAADPALADAFPGVDFDDPIESSGNHGIQDVEWTSSGCRWESSTHEVRVNVAGADDFPDGFSCPAPLEGLGGEIEEIEDLGDSAWWEWDDFQSGKGVLSLCDGELRVEVTVQGDRSGDPIDAAESRSGAMAIAGSILG